MKTLKPEFSVTSTEQVPCPCCGELDFKVIGSRIRKGRIETGERNLYSIRRLRCQPCWKIHHELPDLLIPYKRYEASVIEGCLEGFEPLVLEVDELTTARWVSWFSKLVEYWIQIIISLLVQRQLESTLVTVLSDRSLSVLERIGRLTGDAPDWLARLVQPVVNHHFWLHTRFA